MVSRRLTDVLSRFAPVVHTLTAAGDEFGAGAQHPANAVVHFDEGVVVGVRPPDEDVVTRNLVSTRLKRNGLTGSHPAQKMVPGLSSSMHRTCRARAKVRRRASR